MNTWTAYFRQLRNPRYTESRSVLLALSQQIVEAGWQLVEQGVSDGTSGNISARCPNEAAVLITPSARDYRTVTEQDLARVCIESGTVEGRWKPSSEWPLHVAIYRSRPDVNAVIHSHPTWASAVAVARKTIPVLIDEAADIGTIPTATYAPAGSLELAEAVAHELTKGSNAVLLANHGAVAVGRDVREAMRRTLEVERLAKIYIGVELLGGAPPLDEAAITRNRKSIENYRVAVTECRGLFLPAPHVSGQIQLQDLVSYSFWAGTTFVSLLQNLILQKLRSRDKTADARPLL